MWHMLDAEYLLNDFRNFVTVNLTTKNESDNINTINTINIVHTINTINTITPSGLL
jgi:hypothetical protein